jgi:hypothetical protein
VSPTVGLQVFGSSGGGAGVTPLAFSNLTLGTGITSFGAPYAVPGAAVDGFGVVHLRGLIGGSASNASVVLTLPAVGMRPASRRVIAAADANAARATIALIVETDGTIKNVGTWTSELAHLDGCSFATQGGTS